MAPAPWGRLVTVLSHSSQVSSVPLTRRTIFSHSRGGCRVSGGSQVTGAPSPVFIRAFPSSTGREGSCIPGRKEGGGAAHESLLIKKATASPGPPSGLLSDQIGLMRSFLVAREAGNMIIWRGMARKGEPGEGVGSPTTYNMFLSRAKQIVLPSLGNSVSLLPLPL